LRLAKLQHWLQTGSLTLALLQSCHASPAVGPPGLFCAVPGLPPPTPGGALGGGAAGGGGAGGGAAAAGGAGWEGGGGLEEPFRADWGRAEGVPEG